VSVRCPQPQNGKQARTRRTRPETRTRAGQKTVRRPGSRTETGTGPSTGPGGTGPMTGTEAGQVLRSRVDRTETAVCSRRAAGSTGQGQCSPSGRRTVSGRPAQRRAGKRRCAARAGTRTAHCRWTAHGERATEMTPARGVCEQ
jgi:hypothetical protein